MKMIIAGSRVCGKINQYQWDYERLISIIDKIVKENNLKITLVISGGAKGPDVAGELWAARNNIPVESYIPDWRMGRGAGMIRNAKMAEQGDAVIALYDGKSRGTRNMFTNKSILVVDDNIDTGKTLQILSRILMGNKPAAMDIFTPFYMNVDVPI